MVNTTKKFNRPFTFLDVVVRESSSIFELLSGEDETLLIWGDSLLVLDLCLHVLDRVRRLNLEGDGLARQGLDEDLHRELAEMENTFAIKVSNKVNYQSKLQL